jgi:hypothetical protein
MFWDETGISGAAAGASVGAGVAVCAKAVPPINNAHVVVRSAVLSIIISFIRSVALVERREDN